jgi:putative aldouronate transport system permease protein
MATVTRSVLYRRSWLGRFALHIILLCFSLCCLAPLLIVISASFSDEAALQDKGFGLLPAKWSTFAYQYIFSDPSQILRAYGVTAFVTIVGTAGSLLVMSLLAYVLSRRDFAYRKPLSFYIFFTLLFNGGLVPFYILVTQYLRLKDNVLALILPYMVVPWLVLLLRAYFSSLPHELIEAAKIDGAGEWRIFFQIVMPLSVPALATIGLFCMLRYWNDWYLALLFIDKRTDLYPLQYLLYILAANISALASSNSPLVTNVQLPAQTARMAMAVLAIGPIIFSFLFVQRYLIRGITLGAVKGE